MRLKITFLSFLFFFPAGTASAQNSIIDIALRAKESIVTVYARRIAGIKASAASAAIDPRTGRLLIARNIKTAEKEKKGAGVIINPQGLIVTNFHVINGAQQIAIKFHNDKTLNAKLVYVMPKQDLALLKVSAPFPLRPIEFANSNTATLGQQIIHIGSSDFIKETISEGRIIGLGTSSLKNSGKNVELIEVNINIYKGDSGGPILDTKGRLIGMLAAKLRNKQKASFAIPANNIKKLYLRAVK